MTHLVQIKLSILEGSVLWALKRKNILKNLIIIRKFTHWKSHMNAVSVENVLKNIGFLFNTVVFILEKSLMSVVNVGKPSPSVPASLNTKGFTQEKSLLTVVNVEKVLPE